MNNAPFWILLAREGETTDGHYISAETLVALVRSFFPDIHRPPIYKNSKWHPGDRKLGEIIGVKTESNDGVVCLYAWIRPSKHWFDVPSKQEQDQTLIYPAVGYQPNIAVIDDPYITLMTLTTEPVIKNLEPLNKHMVRIDV